MPKTKIITLNIILIFSIIMVTLPILNLNGEIIQELPYLTEDTDNFSDDFTTTTYEAGSSTAGGWGSGVIYSPRNYTVEHLDFYPTVYPATGLAVQGRKAFVVCHNMTHHYYSVNAFDINDPEDITLLSYRHSIDGAYTIETSGNHLYVGALNGTGDTLNTEGMIASYNATYPTGLSSGDVFLDYEWVNGHVTDIDVEGPLVHYTLYKADDGKSLRMLYAEEPSVVYDIVKDWSNDNALGLEVDGALTYVAASTDGFYIFNTSYDSTPYEVGYVDTPGNATDVILKNDLVFVADGNQGIQIINITDLSTPGIATSFDFDGNARRMVLHEDTLFVAAEDGGLKIIDVSNVANPVIFEELLLNEIVYDVDLFGGIVVVTTDEGIHTFRVSPGWGVESISHTIMPNRFDMYQALDVRVQGNVAYVAGGDDGFYTVDVSNPANPVLLDRYDVKTIHASAQVNKLDVDGTYAYGVFSDGVLIFDIINPRNIRYLNAIPGADLSDVHIQGKILYVSYDTGFGIVNMSTVFSHSIIMDFNTAIHTNITGIWVDGPHLYLVEGIGGSSQNWACYDISDFNNPYMTDYVTRVQGMFDVKVDGDIAYLGSGAWMNLYNISIPTYLDNEGFVTTSSIGVWNFGPYVYSAELANGVGQYDARNIATVGTIGREATITGARQITTHGDYVYVANTTSLVILQHYVSPGTSYYPGVAEAISLEVDAVDDPDYITAATLSANTYIPAGTNLLFFMSADGGSNWEAVTLNTQQLFTNVGYELIWKAEFYGSIRKTAYIFDVSISYEYTVVPTETSGFGSLVSGFLGVLTASSLSIALVAIYRKKFKK
ncbi:MAG: hypothetical protein FK733_09410 [Asgard group archaeon]|nr:hypothetical protein [Asgard group archaeon]